MIKTYGVHDHWTDINKKNDVDIMSEDGVITGIKVNGEDYGGGGGSSDFSTANVTFNVNFEDEPAVVSGALVAPNGIQLLDVTTPPCSTSEIVLPESGTTVIQCFLYKGVAVINVGGDNNEISGNIEALPAHRYKVTGDCTITIS